MRPLSTGRRRAWVWWCCGCVCAMLSVCPCPCFAPCINPPRIKTQSCLPVCFTNHFDEPPSTKTNNAWRVTSQHSALFIRMDTRHRAGRGSLTNRNVPQRPSHECAHVGGGGPPAALFLLSTVPYAAPYMQETEHTARVHVPALNFWFGAGDIFVHTYIV